MQAQIFDDSCDKENTAPANIFSQTGRQSGTLDIKVTACRGGNRDLVRFPRGDMLKESATFLSPPQERSKSRALMALSSNVTNDENNFCSHGEEALLSSRHAWGAATPTIDPKIYKVRNGTSLPALYGSNVTVDSPDPNSKYYARSSPFNKSSDSPEVDASYLAVSDAHATMSPAILGEI